jgi:hypothetical protein
MALCGSTHVEWVKDTLHTALENAPSEACTSLASDGLAHATTMQDIELFVFGASHHVSSRRMMANFFMDNYVAVRPFDTILCSHADTPLLTSSPNALVVVSHSSMSSE